MLKKYFSGGLNILIQRHLTQIPRFNATVNFTYAAPYASIPSWESYYNAETEIVPPPEIANEYLVRLVALKQYPAAERLRSQMLGNGTHIDPHQMYELAAVEALSRPTIEKRIEGLLGWLSHYPNSRVLMPAKDVKPLSNICHALFRSGSPASNINIIIPFILQCIAIGYQPWLHDEFTSFLFRVNGSIPPEDRKKLLLDLENASASWDHAKGLSLDHCAQLFLSYRHKSIKYAIRFGWVDRAFDLLLDAPPELRLTPFLATQLQDHLAEAANLDQIDQVKERLRLFTPLKTRDTEPQRPLDVHPTIKPAQGTMAKLGSTSLPSSPPTSSSLTSFLTRFRLVLADRMPASPKAATRATDAIISMCLSTSEPRYDLFASHRRLALRQPDKLAYIWLSQEMEFFLKTQRYSCVLSLFLSHFTWDNTPPSVAQYLSEHTFVDQTDPVQEIITNTCLAKRLPLLARTEWVIIVAILDHITKDITHEPLPEATRAGIREISSSILAEYVDSLVHRASAASHFGSRKVLDKAIRTFGRLGSVPEAYEAFLSARKLHLPANSSMYSGLAYTIASIGQKDIVDHWLNLLDQNIPISSHSVAESIFFSEEASRIFKQKFPNFPDLPSPISPPTIPPTADDLPDLAFDSSFHPSKYANITLGFLQGGYLDEAVEVFRRLKSRESQISPLQNQGDEKDRTRFSHSAVSNALLAALREQGRDANEIFSKKRDKKS